MYVSSLFFVEPMMVSRTCEPCAQRKLTVDSLKWCSDCEESMCKGCTDCHIAMKATKNHHLLDISVAESYQSKNLVFKCESHPCNPLEYFCEEHGTPCCRDCLSTTLHRSCQKIVSVQASSIGVKLSDTYREVKDEIDHLFDTLSSIISDRKDNIAALERDVHSIRPSIKELKSRIIKTLDNMEVAILQEADQKREEIDILLKREIEQNEKDLEVVAAYQSRMKVVTSHSSERQAFLFMHHLQSIIRSLRGQLIGKISKMRSVSIKHAIPENIVEHFSLGFVEIVESACIEKFKLHKEDYKFFQTFQMTGQVVLHEHTAHRVISTAFKQEPFITGMGIWKDKILLCNCNWNHSASHVLVYSKAGDSCGGIDVNGAPWDIAVLPESDIGVVTLPNKNSIQFVDLAKQKTGSEIKMAGTDEKRGIATTSNKIFVGGMDRFIYVLDHKGNMLSTIFEEKEKFCYLLPVCCDLIFSDCASIHRIRLDGSEVFTFSSPDLKNPKMITLDQLCNLYIAGKDSDTVHRLTPDGKFLDVVLSGKDGIHHPRALCFDQDSNQLFLSNKGGSELLIFKCS